MAVEIKIEKRKCPACDIPRKWNIKVVYDGDREIRSDLCPICETDAMNLRKAIFSKIRHLADSINSFEMLTRLGKHFLGRFTDENKKHLKDNKVTATVIKNVIARKTDLSKLLAKHDPETKIIIMRKILHDSVENPSIIGYLPIERYESSGPLDGFLSYSGHAANVVANKRELTKGLRFINTHHVFEELKKADEAKDLKRIKILYIEAHSRDLNKTQERFINLFKKFNDSESIRKAVYWEEITEDMLEERTLDDLIEKMSENKI
jgi:hypothetical protein